MIQHQEVAPTWIGLAVISAYILFILYQNYRYKTKKCPKCSCTKFKIIKSYNSFSIYKCTNEKCNHERLRFFNYSSTVDKYSN